MVEFNQREKFIIQIMSYLLNPQFIQVQDTDTKIRLLYGMLKSTNDNFNMSFEETKDFVLGIAKQQEDTIKEQLGKMSKLGGSHDY